MSWNPNGGTPNGPNELKLKPVVLGVPILTDSTTIGVGDQWHPWATKLLLLRYFGICLRKARQFRVSEQTVPQLGGQCASSCSKCVSQDTCRWYITWYNKAYIITQLGFQNLRIMSHCAHFWRLWSATSWGSVRNRGERTAGRVSGSPKMGMLRDAPTERNMKQQSPIKNATVIGSLEYHLAI